MNPFNMYPTKEFLDRNIPFEEFLEQEKRTAKDLSNVKNLDFVIWGSKTYKRWFICKQTISDSIDEASAYELGIQNLEEDFSFIKELTMLNFVRQMIRNDAYSYNRWEYAFIFSNVEVELLKESKPHLFL